MFLPNILVGNSIFYYSRLQEFSDSSEEEHGQRCSNDELVAKFSKQRTYFFACCIFDKHRNRWIVESHHHIRFESQAKVPDRVWIESAKGTIYTGFFSPKDLCLTLLVYFKRRFFSVRSNNKPFQLNSYSASGLTYISHKVRSATCDMMIGYVPQIEAKVGSLIFRFEKMIFKL